MGVTDNIYVLPATPTDRERAADYRERMIPLLNSVAAIMNDAAREGMEIKFQNWQQLIRQAEIAINPPERSWFTLIPDYRNGVPMPRQRHFPPRASQEHCSESDWSD